MKNNLISLNDLYYANFALDDIFVMRQKWVKNILFKRNHPRPTTGIILLNNCVGVYTDKSGESFSAPKNSIVCLPYGSEYTCLNYECSSTLNDAILVEFNAIDNSNILTFSDKPFLIRDINIPFVADLFEKAAQSFEATNPSSLSIKACVYTLLSFICQEKVNKHQKRFSAISKGIDLMESDTLCKLSIDEIAQSCNVSPCYFRRLFREYSGKSPQEYRIDMRINIAKKMLETDETTLSYIIEALNFESTSYFCRIFKKKVGVTPSQYKDSINPLDTTQ